MGNSIENRIVYILNPLKPSNEISFNDLRQQPPFSRFSEKYRENYKIKNNKIFKKSSFFLFER